MKASKIFLGALIVVLVIIVIYATVKKPAWSDPAYLLAHFVESPRSVYQRSGGTFDQEAALALDRATGRQAPSTGDHLLAATIITRNIIGQEHRPEVGHDGRPTERAIERAQIRHEMFGRARDHYLAALRGLNAHMAPEPARAGRARGGARGGARQHPRRRRAPPPPDAGFIVDAALDFAVGGAMNAMQHDPLLAATLWGQRGGPNDNGDPGDVLAQLALFIDLDLAGAANQTRDQVIEARREAAREAARQAAGGAPGAATAAYIEMAVHHTDDPQNSHDSGTNGCLRGIVSRLRADQAGAALPSLDTIRAEIRKNADKFGGGDAKAVDDAVEVLERTRLGERNIAIDATDDEILRRVWARADDPRNAANREKMRQAVFDGLRSSWENGIMGRKITCVTGRTGRNIGSLTMLDWDERNWHISTLEQFKNDIFAQAHALIGKEAAAAAESGDPALAKVGRSYAVRTQEESAALGPVDEAASEKFAESLRGKIDQLVSDYVAEVDARAPGAVPPHMIEPIRAEARAAVVS